MWIDELIIPFDEVSYNFFSAKHAIEKECIVRLSEICFSSSVIFQEGIAFNHVPLVPILLPEIFLGWILESGVRLGQKTVLQ